MRSFVLLFALAAALGLAAAFVLLRGDERVQSASAPEASAAPAAQTAAKPEPEARVAVGPKRPNIPRASDDAPRVEDGGEDGGRRSRDVEFAARYADRTPAQLESDYSGLAERVSTERERLLEARFDSGLYDASVITSDDLPEYERRIAKLENDTGKLFMTRCVRPDVASGGAPDGPFEFQSTSLSRQDAPQLFDWIEELQWLESRIDRGPEPPDDEPDHH